MAKFIKRYREEFASLRKELGEQTRYLNSYALISGPPDDRKIEKNLENICLSRLSDDEPRSPHIKWFIDYPFAKMFGDSPSHNFNKNTKAYLRWVFKESAWRDVYLSKRFNDIAYNGIVYDTSFPRRMVVQAAIMPRMAAEMPELIDRWALFARHIDGHLALDIAQNCEISGDTFRHSSDNVANCNHLAWREGEIGPDEYMRMKEDDCQDGGEEFKYITDFRHMNKLWQEYGTYATFKWPEAVSRTVEIERWGEKHFVTRSGFLLSSIPSFCKSFLEINSL